MPRPVVLWFATTVPGVGPRKVCGTCTHASFTSARVCVGCGGRFRKKTRRRAVSRTVDARRQRLEELIDDSVKQATAALLRVRRYRRQLRALRDREEARPVTRGIRLREEGT
jgi:hypothetical protein